MNMKKVLLFIFTITFYCSTATYAIPPGRIIHVRSLNEQTNGEWTYSHDFSGSGPEREFYKSTGFDGKITVPFCLESKLSGVGHTDFIQHFRYQCSISIPQNREGKNILLNFGAVYYKAEIYIDGTFAACHFGGTSSFSVDTISLVKPGRQHSLVVYAESNLRGTRQPAGKQNPQCESYACNYTRTTDI